MIKWKAASTRELPGRAWLEINLANLRHNAIQLQKLMPQGSELMGIIKANAYGHGAKEVSKELSSIGVKSFGVATIDEGIALRKQGLKGEILVLGYTDIKRSKELIHYRLTQTVIDYDYACRLNRMARKPIQVHVKIDTGMHRIGIRAEEAEQVQEIFHMNMLRVCGIFTHLCVADSRNESDIAYTQKQIASFYNLLEQLKQQGVILPKIHIQSSYGLLNYPELQCDYARIGIALYGCLSSGKDVTKEQPRLKPVMELKSRIALIRDVAEGEEVGYGRDFTALRNCKIALLPIGYADGLPRSLSGENAKVLLHGQQAPMIGRICMDQLMIDITDVPEVVPGDIVTIIGQEGKDEISAMDIAAEAGSITNELLSRLGTRLERIYL